MKKTGKNVKCYICGNSVYKAKWQLKNNKYNCCSKKCVIKLMKSIPVWNKGLKGYNSDYPRDEKWRKNISQSLKGEKNYKWIKDKNKVSYQGIHGWLLREYGKANKCENENCDKKSKNYDWALLKDKKYERKIENFWQLCRSCHMKYDK